MTATRDAALANHLSCWRCVPLAPRSRTISAPTEAATARGASAVTTTSPPASRATIPETANGFDQQQPGTNRQPEGAHRQDQSIGHATGRELAEGTTMQAREAIDRSSHEEHHKAAGPPVMVMCQTAASGRMARTRYGRPRSDREVECPASDGDGQALPHENASVSCSRGGGRRRSSSVRRRGLDADREHARQAAGVLLRAGQRWRPGRLTVGRRQRPTCASLPHTRRRMDRS